MASWHGFVGMGWAAALCGALAACAPDVILQGERFDPRTDLSASVPTEENPNPVAPPAQPENQSAPISLPGAQALAGWPQRGGSVRHDSPHGSLSAAPELVWAVNMGAANTRQNRIAAAPVVADGRIFALDARAGLTAVSTAGAILWTADLTPEFDSNSDLSGGGLSVQGGTVFATTGYGEVIAIDAATGALRWRQRVQSVVTGAPLASGDAVYLAARDGTTWALAASDGRVLWTDVGNATATGLMGSAAPALTDQMVIFPLSSGEMLAFDREGTPVWSAAVTGERLGRAYSNLSEVTGDPVVVGERIFAGSASGTTAAFDLATGGRLWTAPHGALGAPLVVGGSVFVVDDAAQLVRLDADSGSVIWSAGMPNFVNEEPKKRKAVVAHFGPVLAGGRLAVVSGDSLLRLFSATDGTLVATAEIPGGAAAPPALAGGLMFVVTARGQLLAFR